MACKECKQKKEFKEEMINSGEFVSKYVIGFAIVWTILGFYGLFSLISKFL